MRNILFLMASSFWLQGCVTTTNSGTFADSGLLYGSIEQPDVWKFGTPLISHPLLSK